MPGYHLPWFTAAAQEVYVRCGLDVELIDPLPGPDNVRAVAGERYDFCLTSVAHFLRAKATDPLLGARFVFIVARRTHMAAFAIEGRPAAHGRPIEGLDDLDGASILGERESPFVREYEALLLRLGASAGERVEVPYDDVMAALAEGRGDVASDFLDLLPAVEAAAAQEGVHVRALPFHEAGMDCYGSGLVAGTRLLERRPEAARRMVAAIGEVLAAARYDPEAGVAAMSKMYPGLDAVRALSGWRAGEQLIFVADQPLGSMDAATWDRTIAHHAATHGTPRLDPALVFDGSFVNEAPLRT